MVDGRVNADIAEVSLNRPEAFNALNLELVTDLAGSDDGIGRRQQDDGRRGLVDGLLVFLQPQVVEARTLVLLSQGAVFVD